MYGVIPGFSGPLQLFMICALVLFFAVPLWIILRIVPKKYIVKKHIGLGTTVGFVTFATYYLDFFGTVDMNAGPVQSLVIGFGAGFIAAIISALLANRQQRRRVDGR